MKVALFEKKNDLRVTTKDLRKLLDDEVLVKVESCGVCGTDVHIVEGESRSSPPVVLGHEYAGVVEDSGSKAGKGFLGKRVAVDPNISCGTCSYCRRGLVHLCANLRALGVDIDGGMAQYCAVPANQVFTVPDGASADVSAFIEPVSCAIHGIDRAGIRAGDTVVILGGGTIGLIMLQLVLRAGAAQTIIVEPLVPKQEIARKLGATLIIDPRAMDTREAVLAATVGIGSDVVIECIGKPETMHLAIQIARRGGTVEFFGVCPVGMTIPVEPNQIYFKELTIVGSYVNPHTFSRSIATLASGNVSIEHFNIDRFPLDGVHEALRYQREGRTIKSIIHPNS
jgi:2-desacetyl-2-hydroxyethyl bacteriochlorophyllide A dehydrogenase